MWKPVLMVTLTAMQNAGTPNKRPIRILTMGMKILSMGGPLQFNKKGEIVYLGEVEPKEQDEISVDGVTFRYSPEFWAMVERNQKEADASACVAVKDGKLYHDGKLVSFDGLHVKWLRKPIFWQDWVIGIGLTSKSGPPRLEYLEPSELVYYNCKTLRGGTILLGGKGAGTGSEPRIMTQ